MAPTALRSAEQEAAFERLMNVRLQTHPKSDVTRIRDAFNDACDLYGDSMHWTGESVIAHCVGVLETFLGFEPDDDGVIACLLHHWLDSKQWTLDDLEKKYGKEVRSIVSGAHLLAHVTMKNRRMSQENLRLMFLRVSDDIRVVLLILCDHNYKLTRLSSIAPEARKNICRDVLNLFAPVAARLGIYSLKNQMEMRAFPVVYPTDAMRIAEQMEQLSEKHGKFLPQAAQALHKALTDAGVNARVESREKQPFSIFQKMRNKSITHVEDIYDLFALRVIVENEAACYQALGVLHRVGHPVVNRFKDYIAFPKPNGYQSLHTTLARLPNVPEGIFIEVQIRTEDMHREADLGIAAHWSYKEGGSPTYAKRRADLQRALTSEQSREEHKSEEFADHIFALTPKGDIIELPEGATPLDFAFAVHSMLGLCFKAARVNGVIVPLNHALENGDIVEVLKHKDPHPSSNWMTILKTANAKSRLKQYLMSKDRPAYVHMGREAMNNELSRHHLPLLDPDLTLLRSLDGKHLTFSEREDILMTVGQGAHSASSILAQVDSLQDDDRMRASRHRKVLPESATAVAKVDGDIPMPVRFALCCKPDIGAREEIRGTIGRDGTVRVHRRKCKMLRNVNRERVIGVSWVKEK